ncbi:MAG: sorbosone dehydrogenase family protein, partial [Gemmatimonadaceae bacterium]|nr:sorbosone dehydrogenase family protein [Acetobacteraceae bacterium]
LPQPDPSAAAARFSRVVGWPDGQTPKPPAGFTVTAYAKGLDSPRWLHVLPNGDVLVSEARSLPRSTDEPAKLKGMVSGGSVGVSPNRIVLLRDNDRDGIAETRHVLLENLNQPFGMALLDGYLHVGNTDGLMRFPFTPGQTRIDAPGELTLKLPAGGYNNHWTRNVIASRDGTKLYVSVGSSSNVGENGMEEEVRRANVLQVNPDGSGEKVYASGLRNPIGMAWEPASGVLWTAVNERDGLGDNLVPDYIAGVREDGFYGWPYSYYGQKDMRAGSGPAGLVERAIMPDYALGAHTASIGLLFATSPGLPERYRTGAFVAQRGSWNRSEFSGYKVVFIPFRDGKPSGAMEDFLTGFMARPEAAEAYGRPVGLAQAQDGAILVADDAGNTVWRVTPTR